MVLVILGGVPSAASQNRISLEEFIERVVRARQLSDEGVSSPSPSRLSRVRATLRLPVIVTTARGPLRIERSAYLDSLSGTRADHFVLASRHLEHIEEHARAAADITATPDAARIDEALKDAYEGITKQPPILARIRRMIGQVLNSLAELIQGASDALGLPATIAAIAGILFISILFFRNALRKRMVPDRLLRIKVGAQEEIDWNARAEEAIRRGDFEEAARARYRSIVGELIRLGIVRNTPSLTAGECRTAVREMRPSLFATVDKASEVFETATYGLVPVTKDDLQLLDDALRAFATGGTRGQRARSSA